MKKNLIINIFLGLSLFYFLSSTIIKIDNKEKVFVESDTLQIKIKPISNWDKLIISMIHVESGNNDSIIGSKNDVGCLQITPIYVKEVNRIIGYELYKLEDRFCRLKSIEMFNILQSYHNPKKNIDKAIKLHNPGAGKDYYNKIMTIYKTL